MATAKIVTKPVKLDEVAEEIRKVSEAMRAFQEGPLTKRAVIVLLADITKLPHGVIKKVLDGAEALESVYLK